MNTVLLKRCAVCQRDLLLTEFDRSKAYADGLSKQCKDCRRAYMREYRAKNHEKMLAYDRAYRAENADYLREYERQYRIKNHAKKRQQERSRYAQNVEREREARREYYARHTEGAKVRKQRRRARNRQLPHTFTAQEWRRCLEYWHGCCAICGRPVGLWHSIAQEHWIPLADPRPDNPGKVATNILPMCHSTKDGTDGCNNTKWARDPMAWLIDRLGKRKAFAKYKEIEAYFAWVRALAGE